jgi:hypothetical protein
VAYQTSVPLGSSLVREAEAKELAAGDCDDGDEEALSEELRQRRELRFWRTAEFDRDSAKVFETGSVDGARPDSAESDEKGGGSGDQD